MSTRSNTIIKQNSNETILYKHHDGYLDGVGVYLKEILEKYGFELFAKDYLNILNTEDPRLTYFEEVGDLAGDSEYIYVVDIDNKTLKYSKRSYSDYSDWPKLDEDSMKLIYEEKEDFAPECENEYVASIYQAIAFHKDMISSLESLLESYRS